LPEGHTWISSDTVGGGNIICLCENEPVYDQKEAEDYIFMNPVKRERIDRGWTQEDLAQRLGVKQSTVAKWEKRVLSIEKIPGIN